MGYDTSYKGTLYFTTELFASQIAHLESLLGNDASVHSNIYDDYGVSPNLSYIDLQFTKEFDGLEWNQMEKSHNMADAINFILGWMREKYDNFGLKGELLAQGDGIGDIRKILIKDGKAIEVILTGKIVECPECKTKFRLSDED